MADLTVYYVNRAPIALNGCCCEIANEIGAGERPRAWKIVGAFVLAAALAVAAIGIVRAAQPADHMRPHEITLSLPPVEDRPNIMTISAAYPDREACEKAKKRVVVKASGAKLVCGIANPFRVK